jgi:CRP-like cAMP-binding protein
MAPTARGAEPSADHVLFLADDPGHSCYRVEVGLLKVTMVSRSGVERILSFIGRGEIVGELAILNGLPRSAAVVAVRNTELSRLTRAEFDAFADRNPEVYKSLITLLTQRLRETNVAVAAGKLSVAARSRCSRVARIGLHFVPEAGKGVAEMRRVVRSGGVVAAAVWDHLGGMPGMRMMVDTVAALSESGRHTLADAPRAIRASLDTTVAAAQSWAMTTGSTIDIGGWLRGLGLGQYEAAFRENEIDDTRVSFSDAAPQQTRKHAKTGKTT